MIENASTAGTKHTRSGPLDFMAVPPADLTSKRNLPSWARGTNARSKQKDRPKAVSASFRRITDQINGNSATQGETFHYLNLPATAVPPIISVRMVTPVSTGNSTGGSSYGSAATSANGASDNRTPQRTLGKGFGGR
jgi:hypothetical protein